MAMLLELHLNWSREHVIRPRIVCAEITISELSHPRDHTKHLVQPCVDLGCDYFQQRKPPAHCMNTLRRLHATIW